MSSFDVRQHIQSVQSQMVSLSDAIWGYAETRFEEHESARVLKDFLRSQGFSIKENVAGMETAFIAEYGSGSPVVGILAEYDALSGMSQSAGLTYSKPEQESGNGHGCGHHLFGVASAGAAVAAKAYLEQTGQAGTVRLLGCPGEEGGSGKAYMVRGGLFDTIDLSLAWHPATVNAMMSGSMLATQQSYFRFSGVSSHAAASPHLGRSALDAVELMNVGVNYLREHMEDQARVHYAITDTGGHSPNVVQSHAEVLYLVRSHRRDQVDDLYRRVCKIAQGAALMTETELEIIFNRASSNYIPNRAVERVMYNNFVKAGAPDFDQQDDNFACEIKKTFSEGGNSTDVFLAMLPKKEELKPLIQDIASRTLCSDVLPYVPTDDVFPGSTDVGDVSWVTPTAQFAASCFAIGTPPHSWQMVSQGKSPLAHKGMFKAAEVLAMTAIDFFNNPSLVEEAQREFSEVRKGNPYSCPIPPDVQPSPISG